MQLSLYILQKITWMILFETPTKWDFKKKNTTGENQRAAHAPVTRCLEKSNSDPIKWISSALVCVQIQIFPSKVPEDWTCHNRVDHSVTCCSAWGRAMDQDTTSVSWPTVEVQANAVNLPLVSKHA